MGESEVARIMQDIETAYMAARWGLTGLAYGTAQHRFITARMERIEQGREKLQELVGEQATAIVAETLSPLPEYPTREHLQAVLRSELGESEDTEHLLDYLEDSWETFDLLVERFGRDTAEKIITAASASSEPAATS